MDLPIKVSSIPDSIRAQYDNHLQELRTTAMSQEVPRQYQRNSEDMQLLKFPNTKNILWDHTSTGQPLHLHISYYRKPKLSLSEKVLRFAQRHAESTNLASCDCTLVGTLSVDEDGEGVVFELERLEPRATVDTSGLHAPGDMLIPFTIQSSSPKDRGSSSEDYNKALMLLRQRCLSKDPVEISNFLLTKGWCNFYSTGDKSVFHLDFDVVTMATEIKAVPISPVPIVPTALSKNLSGPMSISHMQGQPKTGYLTMDHTRKLLLVLESDPKVINLPLVGIWISGVPYAYSPYVWACCLRYIHNASLQDRVCVPPETFLLVLYNPLHSKPEFYECTTVSGNARMTFDLYTGYEAVGVDKVGTSDDIVDIDLTTVQSGQKKTMFDVAVGDFDNSTTDEVVSTSKKGLSGPEEITPRCQPAPHKSRMPVIQPMVPEVSLFFGDGDSSSFPPEPPKSHVPSLRLSMPQRDQRSKLTRKSTSPQSSPVSQDHSESIPRTLPHSNSLPNMGPAARPQTVVNSEHISPSVPNSIGHPTGQPYPQQPGLVPSSYARTVNNLHCQQPSVPTSHFPQPSQVNMPSQTAPYPPPHGTHVMNNGYNNYGHSVPCPQQQSVPPSAAKPRFPVCGCPHCPKPSGDSNVPVPNVGEVPRGYCPPRPVYQQTYGPPPPRLHPSHPHRCPGVQGQPQNPAGVHPPQPLQPYMGPPSNPGYVYNHPIQSDLARHMNGPVPHSYAGMYSRQQNVPPVSQNVQEVTTVASSQGPTGAPKTPVEGSGPFRFPAPVNCQPSGSEPVRRVVDDRRNNVPHSDSSRSSDDSGLSVTPEKNNSPKVGTLPKSPTKEGQTTVPTQKGINWEQVPPEIYQLLLQQDQQLKQLQAQIQVLTAQQAAQSLNNSVENPSAKTSSSNTQDSPREVEKCNIAVNTSLVYPEPRRMEQVSACMQTSPQKVHRSSLRSSSGDNSGASSSGSGGEFKTPMEIRHRGRRPMNSTHREDVDFDMSQGDVLAVMDNVAIHNQTVDSVQSEMIVDLPSFQSSPTRSPRSQEDTTGGSVNFSASPRSPISASMCEQQGEDSEEDSEEEIENHAGADNPEYYNKLMDNIKKLLSQNTTEADSTGAMQDTTDPNSPVKLAQQSIRLGEQLQSFLRLDPNLKNVDTTFIPKINYVSMFLDSDSDTSMEINAMAMKYLKDEQLTRLTKLQSSSKVPGSKGKHSNALLQRILMAEDDSSPDVTTLGMSQNNLTFATKKYLEKHGLLNGSDTTSGTSTGTDATYNESYQLRMNYSSLSSGSEEPAQLTHEVLRTPTNNRRITVVQEDSQRTAVHITPNSHRSSQQNTPVNATPSGITPNSHRSSQQNTPVTATPSGRQNYGYQLTPDSVQRLQNNTHNSSVPLSHNSPVPHWDVLGAKGRYASPQMTPAPPRPNHSPPEKDIVTEQFQQNGKIGARDSVDVQTRANAIYGNKFQNGHHNGIGLERNRESPLAAQNQGIQNHGFERRQQFVQQTDADADDDRILDITRLKQLPKLL